MAGANLTSTPRKPYPDFPLFAHRTGQWAKKIKGRHHYFGPLADPDGALKRYLQQRDALYAGRTPRTYDPAAVPLRQLCNVFLTAKQQLVATGERSQRHFEDLHRTCGRLIEKFGAERPIDDLRAEDFVALRDDFAQRWEAPTTLKNELARVRNVFNYAHDTGVIENPIRGIKALTAPSARSLRKHRQSSPKRLYSRAAIRSMLNAASGSVKAFILLGINCAFGNRDCALVPEAALDLASGWVQFPRTKTAIDRRCHLWEETCAAVRESMASRPTPKQDSAKGLAFLTAKGNAWGGDNSTSALSSEFRKTAETAGCYTKGLGFYALRHTFATIGEEGGDPAAVRHVMGHVDQTIAAVYREHISDDRLIRLSRHVQGWLFG